MSRVFISTFPTIIFMPTSPTKTTLKSVFTQKGLQRNFLSSEEGKPVQSPSEFRES